MSYGGISVAQSQEYTEDICGQVAGGVTMCNKSVMDIDTRVRFKSWPNHTLVFDLGKVT